LPDTLPFATCDVFTDRAFAGNPLAIVEDAGALSTAQMQTIAREFNLSETIFVMEPRDPAHSARVRIFFPTAEIPFAGHPTIGCAIHLALKTAPVGDFQCTITLEEEAGLVPVTVTRQNGNLSAELTAPVLPFATEAPLPGAGLLAGMLGLAQSDIGFGTHGPGVFEGGPAFLYVPVKTRSALAMAQPLEPQWSRVMALTAVDSAYLYTLSDHGISARMFSPAAGIPEDPATGSASAILAAQLLASGALAEGTTTIDLLQGEDMGRPSQITLRVEVENAALKAVHVAGSAVAISRGSLTVPAP
jgi:trans-2,3-dihydro-3-hydroxyanthranilate isomerase